MKHLILVLFVVTGVAYKAQVKTFTTEDTLKGSNTSYRNWWDVQHYDLTVKPDFRNKFISGSNTIKFKVTSTVAGARLQLDLQMPMKIDSLFMDGIRVSVQQESNRWMLPVKEMTEGSEHTLKACYSGKPQVAKNPPWDGGWVWRKDSLGNPWMSVACQGNGASIWFPCKDIQSEEPDNGVDLHIIVPDSLVGVGNGRLIKKQFESPGFTKYSWRVINPINSYDIIPYIGKYVNLHDSVHGEKGTLQTDYWVLSHHVAKAKAHLKPNVINTIKCFEHWFGPYPFYEDSYKIVESPYLGMEHQSNIAYGNFYINGYMGRDLSNTGWGLKWDFIVVHESGHEWFGNSVTARDVADNWIHEGITSYSEVLFTECYYGKEAGNDYCTGVRKQISNDIPVIGKYGVKEEGSGDMYNKGSSIIHMIRQMMNDDEKFRQLLRDISSTYYHKTVSTAELETFIQEKTGLQLSVFFDQYLRTTQIPKLEYKLTKKKLQYRYTNCLEGFAMPVKITAGTVYTLKPTTQWQTLNLDKAVKSISLDRNVDVELVK